ncbi:glycosyltransferase [Microbispora bryophytorum]|uniref:Glycosyl transferase n=1 Tax=Microbispora bryophytorum TaxID=1460882 RepID=A0A8H9H314_9ACTN|nr:glycosyltransferase [Microbispora bryophytorum]MBD3137935.1 glycosyltransferase [Microbispora bryophytorum]TQS05158.1 glycosyltransferase family 1 protein [Microbispora bryophytorum]GGO22674.1 glycosyl transferase [Microbispora bryophytorum]
MKIAMVSEHASPLATLGGVDAGGQNVHVAALARELAGAGHEVTVYTRKDREGLPETVAFGPGVVVVHVPVGPASEISKDEILPWIPQFGKWLHDRWLFDRPDIVHSHFWMSGLAALAAAEKLRIPVVHTYHALGSVKRRHQGPADTSPRDRIEAEAEIGRRVDGVIATCNDEVDELIRMRVPRRATRVVPCGVDVTAFHPHVEPLERPERPRLLSVGRLVPRKGLETTIRALQHLRDAELVIAGGPPAAELHHDPEVTRLRWLAAQAGVSDRIRFLGRVERDTLPSLMRSATAVVSVPWYEPFGMVALEAMACGVPVVASAVGGQKETVVNTVTGLLVPPRKPVVLAKALRKLLDDRVRRTAYGIAGADRARARYAWSRIAAETLAAYDRVLCTRELERRAS